MSLVWAGWMLFILGWWMGTKHEELSRLVVFVVWLLAAVAFICGIRLYLVLGRPADAEQKQAALARQRSLLGILLIVGAVVLAGIAIYMALEFKLAAFGEVVGMFLVCAVAVFSGLNLRKPVTTATDVHPFFDWLRRQHAPAGLALLIVGGILGLASIILTVFMKLGQDWFPEMAGLLLLGILGISGGIWLILAQGEQLTTARMRGFVLVVGGVAGLILALGALARAIIWRDDVFGGMRAWQGGRSWHLWLCAYVELVGLALMFGSLLLARTDIRSSAPLRRALYGYNAVLTGLLLLAMLVVVNIVLFALVPFSFEWSKSRGAHSLSVSSKNLLANLREPTKIYVLLSRWYVSAELPELKNFLDNCESQSSNLEVKYLDPLKDYEEYALLAKRFPDSLSGQMGRLGGRSAAMDRGILVVYGSMPADTEKKVPHAFINVERLEERKPMQSKEGKSVVVFKGEMEVMNEISALAQDRKQQKVYILQGDREPDVGSDKEARRNIDEGLENLGAGLLVEHLKKSHFDVQGLTFAQEFGEKKANLVYAKEAGPEKRKEVPDDAEALFVVGPSATLSTATLDGLERYMDRGGKLLVYLDLVLDPKTNTLKATGLEDFLRKYGVQVGKEFAMGFPDPRAADPRTVFGTVPRDTTNELAKAFAKTFLWMDTARVVRPDPASQKYKVDVILNADPTALELRQAYWEETNPRALTNPDSFVREQFQSGELRKRVEETRQKGATIPLAVAVSEKQLGQEPGKETAKPRMVVFGDAEFVTNLDILVGRDRGSEVGLNWTTSALEWLSARKTGLIGPRAKEATSYVLNPQTVNVDRLAYLPGWLMMLGIVGLGGGIWVTRRR